MYEDKESLDEQFFVCERKFMVVNSLFYGALRCTDVMFDGVVCFYRGFVYDIFIHAFSW